MNLTVTTYVEVLNVEVGVHADVDFRPGVPAKTYGPPENCWPAEPAEIEINGVTLFDASDRKTPLECPRWLHDAIVDALENDMDDLLAKAQRQAEEFDE